MPTDAFHISRVSLGAPGSPDRVDMYFVPFAGRIPLDAPFYWVLSLDSLVRIECFVIDCLPAFNQLLITRLVVAIVVGRVVVVAAIALKCPSDNTATSSSKHFSTKLFFFWFLSVFRPSHFSLEIFGNT